MTAHRSLRALAAAAALLLAPAAAFAQAGASPYTSGARYDAMGRATGTIAADPDGTGPLRHAAVRTFYDGAGRPIRVETGELAAWQSEAVAPPDWAGFAIFRTLDTAYDAMGRKLRDTLREGTAGPVRTMTQYSYDSLGRLECTAIRMNPAAFASLPASACAPGPAGADGPDRIVRTLYDAAGQRLQVREGVGTPDEGTEATWAYNLNGQITTVIDGNGNRAELRYDGHGRQDRWTFPSATGPASFDDANPASALASAGAVNPDDYEAYGYDPNGNRTSLRKRDGSILGYSFDALNRMTVKTVPERADLTAVQTRDVFYSYDLRNLQLSARFDSPAGEGVTNAYDGFGRLASSSTDLGGVARTLAYAHDRNGNRIAITYPDGVTVTLDHDGIDRPYFLSSSLACCLLHMAYHPNGAPLASSRPDGSWSWLTYDPLQRLASLAHHFPGGTSDVTWSFGRNAAGQLATTARDNDFYAWTRHYAVNRAYATNGLNQYSAAGSASFTYDANGNLIADGTNSYGYDIENRMVAGPNGATLAYDPLGRLFQVTGPAPLATVTTFLYDGDALVAEYDGSNAMIRRHLHWPGADVPVTTWEGPGFDPRQLHADERGSIVALDNANGVPTINTYDEYGIPGATNVGRFQYTGQIWLPELRMYHYKARVYSPTLGRFMQTDLVGYEDQHNLYAYVGNDPLNRTDPTGEQSCGNPPCPDIYLIPRTMRDRTAASIGRAGRGGEERGLQLYRNRATGEEREARRGYAANGDYVHIIHRARNESLVILSHVHNRSDQPGTAGQALTRRNNAPSEGDQAAMNEGGVPVQVVGPHNTGTLYRENSQDYYAVETGDMANVPNLSDQQIIVVDRRKEDEEGRRPQ